MNIMKKSNADVIRARVLAVIINLFDEMGEDLGVISSGALNFPIVADDGEEGWVEVHVKIPKGTKDEAYDGYGRRNDYRILVAERAEKAKAKAEAKAKKIARDKARREKESE